MKHLQACLSAKEDRKSSFHRCGGPVRLVQGGAVKHVQAYLSARDDRESSFHRSGGPVRLDLFKCQGRSRKLFSPL